MSAPVWVGVGFAAFAGLVLVGAAVGRLLGGRSPRPPPRERAWRMDAAVAGRLKEVEDQRFELEGKLTATIEEMGVLANDKRALVKALVEIDTAAGEVLYASLAGQEIISISAELHTLDEVRGRVWASYNAASDALKRADPNHPFGRTT